MEHFWNKEVSGHCLNFDKFFLGITLAEILINVAILCLPLRVISGLQLPMRHKIPLFITFLIGGLNIARIYLTFKTVNFVDGIIWSNIHLGTAILCACLPTYRPLIVQCTALSTSFFQHYDSLFSNKSRSENISLGHLSQSTHPNTQQLPYRQLNELNSDQAVQVSVSGGLAPGDVNVSYVPHSIGVRMTIEIV
ncbi:hypothetical protein MMC31_007178 [Peltigera leucophlebia]|nr:hypothetical protein [Peltigera leucophlebia]